MPIYIALDGYSSLTSTGEDTMKQLGLSGIKKTLVVKGFQATTTQQSYAIDIEIVSKLDGKSYVLKNVKTVPDLDLPSQTISIQTVRKFKHLQNIPLITYKAAKPTILVGMDNFDLHFPKEVKLGKPGEPAAIRTEMGWAVIGPTIQSPKQTHHSYHMNERIEDPLHYLVKQYFTTEYVGVKPNLERPRSKDDIKAQVIMDQTIRRVRDGWESGLLWRDEDVKLPCNKQYAYQRLKSMERKMDKDPQFAKQYIERIAEYQEKGFARLLSPEEANIETDKTFYLPHFMAYNEKKPKKYRFVFDAAAKVNGKSLNDHLLQGPDKLVSLPGALLKFRQRRIGVTADIKDMFHRIKIRKEDASAQRFLWRGLDRTKEPDVMEMGVLIFGSSCSPACAQEAKNKNAEEFKEEFPEAYEAIVNRHYMDDLLDSYDTEEVAIQLHKEITEVHRRGSFNICNWLSNNSKVMNAIPEELRSKSMQSLDINREDQVERVLGLFWSPEEDQFTFCLKYLKAGKDVLSGMKVPTKREVLSLVMSVFDPLGYVATLTVKAKIIMQHTWRREVGWDDEIPSSTHGAWKNWLQQLKKIPDFKIPRCYDIRFSKSTSIQLHIFGDASEEAFGAVAYFRISTENIVKTALVMAKSNVAPIKHLTIPRLELQAAVMSARLAKFIHDQHEVKIHRTVFWCDNHTVLDWLRADGKRFQQFVGSRIGEIQELTDVAQWKWIPSQENVADELTRMDTDCDWSPNSRWINGPTFLSLEEDSWPNEDRFNRTMSEEATAELKKEQVLHVTEDKPPVIDASRSSSWGNLVGGTAWIFRLITKCQNKPRTCGPLSISEFRKAQDWWNRRVQLDSFGTEIEILNKQKDLPKASRLKGLSLKLEDGVIVLAGRLDNSNLPTETKRPIILDNRHPYTKLLVQHFHRICGHHGQERIANELRQQYHILGLRAAVKKAQNSCQQCKNRKVIPTPPEMGQLPKFRVEKPEYAFTCTGLDYFGPINITVKRSTEKRYVALFTCLATRAVHLELAGSLTTDSCIMAIRRFCARRGCPAAIYSDNGTNFHGANNELKKAMLELDQDKMKSSCKNRGIDWHWIPPSAAHFGGSWERMVRSVKVAMGDVLEDKNLQEEVLNTVLAEAEHTVNCHPLTHVPVDPNDPEVLTPNHFLIRRCSNLEPIGEFDRTDLFGRKQWRRVQAMADQFWHRWVKEYLPTLLRRQKWMQTTKPISVGDIVLEVSDNLPRNSWPMGRVVKLFPGNDNIVRAVDIVLANGHVFRRPVAKLCVLDVQPSEEPQPEQN